MTTAEMSAVGLRDGAGEVTAPPTQLHELTPGLLLFFDRPSPLQTWAETFGHEWRHVGVTVQTDAGLMIASYGHRKCFRLDSPFEIMGAYTRVGVAQIFSTDVQVQTVEAFCRRFEHLERADAPYAYSSIIVGPLHLMARRLPPGAVRRVLLALIYLYCWLQSVRYRERPAFVCSTFAWAIIEETLDRPLRIPLSAHPDDEAAYATPSTKRDEMFARWLCGPTEIWNAISVQSRAELDLTNIGDSPEPECLVDAAEHRAEPESYLHLRRNTTEQATIATNTQEPTVAA